MSSPRRLGYAAFAFAILWTAGMMWWNSPMITAHAIILIGAGAVAGFIWYSLMRVWIAWSVRVLR